MTTYSIKMTNEEYERKYWPIIQQALKLMLTQPHSPCALLSFEEVYGSIYKCVCNQFSERLFNDACTEVSIHLTNLSSDLKQEDNECLIRKFDTLLTQYKLAVEDIVLVFTFLNKMYLGYNKSTDFKKELFLLFAKVLVDVHIERLINALQSAQLVPFTIDPAIMGRVVKELYTLKKDYLVLSPKLFAKYIPNVLPPMALSELPNFVAETKQLQKDLVEKGFSRENRQDKRAGDDDVIRGISMYPSPESSNYFNEHL